MFRSKQSRHPDVGRSADAPSSSVGGNIHRLDVANRWPPEIADLINCHLTRQVGLGLADHDHDDLVTTPSRYSCLAVGCAATGPICSRLKNNEQGHYRTDYSQRRPPSPHVSPLARV